MLYLNRHTHIHGKKYLNGIFIAFQTVKENREVCVPAMASRKTIVRWDGLNMTLRRVFCMRFWGTFSQDRGFPKGGCFFKSNYMVYLSICQYMNRLKTKLK